MKTSLQFFGRTVALIGGWVKPFRTVSRAGAFTCLAFLLLAGQAQASFHTWKVNEIYVNADGSVQFIELQEGSGFNSQNALSTHFIRCVSGPVTNSFTFPTNLPSTATAGKTFIIGTANLASVPGGVAPNYVVPANFILPNSGSINFAGVDTVTYTNLPADGVASLVRSGGSMVFSAANSPKNFNGEFNSLVPVKIQSISQSGTDFILSFATASGTNVTAGPNYAVEFNTVLTSAGWSTLTNVAGVGAITNVTDVSPTDPERYYRLRVP